MNKLPFAHRNHLVLPQLGLAAMLLGSVACSGVDQPTQQDYDQVAQAIGPLVAQDVGAGGALSTITASARGKSAGAVLPETRTAAAGDLSWTIDVKCSDAAGAAQDVCNELTDSAIATASFDGEIALPNYQASVSASGTWTLAGLQSTEVTATGDADLTASSTFTPRWNNETRTFDLDLAKSYDLTFPVGDVAAVHGSLHSSVDVQRTRSGGRFEVDRHFAIDVAVELPGDGTAIVTLDGTARYLVNLQTGDVTSL